MSSVGAPLSIEETGRLWSVHARDWAAIQEDQFRPVYEAVIARTAVGAGTHYLDIACGAGMAAELAAARGALVSGLDAAEGLLAIARRRLPTGDFRLGDLEALPFSDAAFDVVAGINAFQFAASAARALAEARRVMRPGGRIAIVTWGDPDKMEAARLSQSIRPLLPPPAPGAPPGPLALSDEAAVRRLAAEQGLLPEEVFEVDSPFHYPDLAVAVRGLNASGVAVRAIEHSGARAVSDSHAKVLAPFRQADGSYRIKARFRCILARAPG